MRTTLLNETGEIFLDKKTLVTGNRGNEITRDA